MQYKIKAVAVIDKWKALKCLRQNHFNLLQANNLLKLLPFELFTTTSEFDAKMWQRRFEGALVIEVTPPLEPEPAPEPAPEELPLDPRTEAFIERVIQALSECYSIEDGNDDEFKARMRRLLPEYWSPPVA